MKPASRTLMIATSLLVPGLAAAQPASVPRPELERLQAQLDRAVAQVSRPSAGIAVGRVEGARGYHLPGYGAVFVLAPRTLPRARGVMVLGHDPASGAVLEIETAGQAEETRPPDAPTPGPDRRSRIRSVGRPLPLDPDEARELAEFEAQVMAFQREAEEVRQSAEREFEQLVRAMQGRLAPSPPVPPEPALPVEAPEAPRSPRAPVPPPPPTAPFPPPWRFWFESREATDARAPEQVVADVRSAVISTLEAHGALVSGLGPDEHLAVAVDFLPGGAFVAHARPSKTLVVRARRKDLEEHARGRLSPEELRKRIEIVEY
jgi:hypothetical protein